MVTNRMISGLTKAESIAIRDCLVARTGLNIQGAKEAELAELVHERVAGKFPSSSYMGYLSRLRDLARMLGNQVRASDLLARYGGEEFAVIMPDLESGSTVKVAERLRAAVESHVISGQGAELKVTISMGVATATKDDIDSPAELISAADKALYRAKEKGRNRVEW